jgi:lipoprotein-anchoring transpeptidase ErfK/SrfK
MKGLLQMMRVKLLLKNQSRRAAALLLVVLLWVGGMVTPALANETDACVAANTCGIAAALIEAYPRPNVRQMYADNAVLLDRVYRRMNGVVNVHDAPNGNVVNSFGSGFNFVTVLNAQGDWSEISPGRWVPSSQLTDNVEISSFAGVMLPEEPLQYPMGWIMVNLYPSDVPGGEPNKSDVYSVLLRYTTVNLYSSVLVDGWRWYQVGVNKWVEQRNIAKYIPMARTPDIDTEKWVTIDLYEQVAIAYELDKPVYATLISSGLKDWETPEGLFHVYVRYPRTVMSGGEGQEDFYYLEEVPWTQYFIDDVALHGAYWHDGFGYRRSHGCVNMSITDAKWFYEWASSELDFTIAADTGAAVLVYSSGEYR